MAKTFTEADVARWMSMIGQRVWKNPPQDHFKVRAQAVQERAEGEHCHWCSGSRTDGWLGLHIR